jgi:hypothetical protein
MAAGCAAIHWRHDKESGFLHVEQQDDGPPSEMDLSLLTNITSQMISLSS